MIDNIIEPTLVVNQKICRSNIMRMAEKARTHNLIFRPHFKTHQSIRVGEWYRDYGVTAITVSSVRMAQFFSKSNWNDITVAFPLNPREIDRINNIDDSVSLNLTIENQEAINIAVQRLKRDVGIFIKIDTGYNRTGIWHSDSDKINILLKTIDQNKLLTFKGFLIHAGHSYKCTSKEEVINIHNESIRIIQEFKVNYKKAYPDLIISYGDTPTCSLGDDFFGIDEIRPGNFAFFDLMQEKIGSCSMNEIAVAVACPVVAKHPGRKQVIIHGGAVHFSKEFILKNNRYIFGKRVAYKDTKWDTSRYTDYLINLSQEHGIMEVKNPSEFNEIRIGDLVYFLPIHSCLTANLLINHQTPN